MSRMRACRRPMVLVALTLLSACAGAPKRDGDGGEPAAIAAAEVAAPGEVGPFAACRMAGQQEIWVVDETRRRLHETVCGAALWFDGLFGEGDLAAARAAHGRFEISLAHSEFEGTGDPRIRFHARVRFPALQNRLSAFVGRDDDEDFVRDRSEGLALRSQFPQVEDEDEWLAGLGYGLPEAYRIRTDFKVGVRARGLQEPKVFVQGRVGYTPYADDTNLVHLRATPFFNNIDGLGLTGSLDLSHALAATRLLRWGTIGTVAENTAGLDWRSALILYQNLRALRAIAYETFVRGATTAPEPLAEYGARAIYRQPLLRARLFAELIAGYSWPRTDPALAREGSFGASLGFELPFGAE